MVPIRVTLGTGIRADLSTCSSVVSNMDGASSCLLVGERVQEKRVLKQNHEIHGRSVGRCEVEN